MTNKIQEAIWQSNESINHPVANILTLDTFPYEVIKDVVYWETKSLISPSTDIGKLFNNRIKDIASRLLPWWDFSELPFLMSHRTDINAYYFQWNDDMPEHIAITQWMLKFCKTEDELVAVVAHELWHWYKHHRVWEWNNTRWEEMFSEIWLMGKMYDAWWNPEAIYNIINRLHKKSFDKQLMEIFDVHGLSRSMVTTAKNALVYVKTNKWWMPENSVFGDKDWLLSQWKYCSFDAVQKTLSAIDINSQYTYLQEYCKILFWHKNINDVTADSFDAYLSQKNIAGEFSHSMTQNILKDASVEHVKKMPLMNEFYNTLVKNIWSPQDLLALVSQIPLSFRYDTTISISAYQKLQQFSSIQFLKKGARTDSFYEDFTKLFVERNDIMVIFQLRKMFLSEIDSSIFARWNPISNIVSYSRSRSDNVVQVFGWVEIIELLKKGYKLWNITIDDIRSFIWYIAKTWPEKFAIENLIYDISPISLPVVEVVLEKEDTLIKINIDEKEQKIKEACEKINLYIPQKKYENDFDYDYNMKNEQLKKLLTYYNQLITADKNNIDFVATNLLSYLKDSPSIFFVRLTREAVVRFIIKYKDQLSEKAIDNLFHALWFYNFVLDFNFGYITFHHYLFAWDKDSGFPLEENIEWESVKTQKEDAVDAFFVQYVDLFNQINFVESDSIWCKIKEIIAVAKNRVQVPASDLVDSVTTLPYRREALKFDDILDWGHHNIMFWLKRESFKKTLQRIFLQDQPEYHNLHSIVDFYLKALEHDILSQNKEVETFILQKILTYLEKENSQVQYNNIIKILLHHTIDIPHIRLKFYDIFTAAVQKLVTDKTKSLTDIFDDLSKCNLIDKYTIIETICSTMVTQEHDSIYAKKSIFAWMVNSNSINELDHNIFKEQAWIMFVWQVENKAAIIDYLLSDWDQDSLDVLTIELLAIDPLNMFAAIKDFLQSKNQMMQLDELSDSENPDDRIALLITQVRDNKDIKAYRELLKTHRELAMANEVYSNLAKLYRQNYRSSPFWIRALLLDHVANHVTEKWGNSISARELEIEEQENTQKYMYEKIIASILPQTSSYGASCKKVFDVYYQLLKPYEKTLFLSAIIAWSEKITSANTDEQIGTILAHVLWSMWPAETKFWQALHSYPNTPKELSMWLYRLKSHAQVPPMWQIREMIKDPSLIPSEISNTISNIKNVYAWSIHITIVCENTDWNEVVLTIQRENALERIKEWFRMISAVIKTIWEDRSFEYLSNHAQTILQEAKHITENELDSDIMKKQYINADAVYSGCVVKYNTIEASFEIPTLIAYWTWYKYISYLPWAHFNDIANSRVVSSDLKKSYAKIVLFKELLLDYQWKPTDKDRHWDNIRIDFDKSIIGNFDFWGMTLLHPTDLQKKLLWSITSKVYSAYAAGTNEPLTVFLKVIDDFIKDSPLEIHFFATLQQRLLSLWDYFKLLSKDDIQEVIVWVLSQDIDPIVKETIEKEIWLPLSLLAWMSKFSISYKPKQAVLEPVRIEPITSEKKFDPLKDFL